MRYLQSYFLFEDFDPDDIKAFTYREWDDVFKSIKSYPVKFKLTNFRMYTSRLLDDGLDTALNNSTINYFYQEYLYMKKRRSYILNIPANINKEPYNKINEYLKYIEQVYVPQQSPAPISLFATPNNPYSDWKIKSVELHLKILHNLLLYDDYFGGTEAHQFVDELMLDKSLQGLTQLNKIFDRNSSEYAKINDRRRSDKTIRLIESFRKDLYQESKNKFYQRFDL